MATLMGNSLGLSLPFLGLCWPPGFPLRGLHNVTATLSGFKKATRQNIEAGVNDTLSERHAARQLQFNLRLSLIKYFPLNEPLGFPFRAEALNALNHVNFNQPNMGVTGTPFASVTGQGSRSRQFLLF